VAVIVYRVSKCHSCRKTSKIWFTNKTGNNTCITKWCRAWLNFLLINGLGAQDTWNGAQHHHISHPHICGGRVVKTMPVSLRCQWHQTSSKQGSHRPVRQLATTFSEQCGCIKPSAADSYGKPAVVDRMLYVCVVKEKADRLSPGWSVWLWLLYCPRSADLAASWRSGTPCRAAHCFSWRSSQGKLCNKTRAAGDSLCWTKVGVRQDRRIQNLCIALL
jgi:hypothetical protein